MAVTWSVILLIVVFSAGRTMSSTTTFNAAPGKVASQSSVFPRAPAGLTADKAIDGKTDNIDNCASTNEGDWAVWWKVDLGGTYTVTAVVITNRAEFGARLHDFTATVCSDNNSPGTVCGQYRGAVASAATVTVTCDQIIWGRNVKITKPVDIYNDTLTLCEVQVMVIDRKYMVFGRQTGKTTTSDVTVTMTTDLPTCAQACKTASDCLGINYNRVQRECQLLNSTHSEDTSVNNGWDFYVVVV